ncbi:uncharacterized protein [Pempheris klunzingeri]|uniref:uncharacterized protein n=1 Tax=Pempheris klunzingeri TaxID=3127111 RepID=UPI00397FCF51
MVRGDRVRLVLRSRQQVEKALMDYHNELNHLDVNKCLRLLNERYFWKTMKSDVILWINSCSQCSKKKRKRTETEPGGSESHLEALTSPQIRDDLDSGKDEDGYSDDDGSGNVGDEETPPATNSEDTVEKPLSPQPVTPINPQPRIPILLHLRTPINFQPKTPIILQPRTPNAPLVARLWSVKRATNSPNVQPEDQSSVQVQVKPQLEERTQPQDQKETRGSQGSARTHRYVRVPEEHGPPDLPQTASTQVQPPSRSRGGLKAQTHMSTHGCVRLPEKRKGDLEAGSSAKRSSSGGLEPVVAPSTKPWPVFTITGSAPTRTAKPPPEDDSSAPVRSPRRPQARTIVQQCSNAKVKTKPAVDGADAQWAEIQEGLVVYVCFFHGATEDVTDEMASSLMTTKLFRKDSGHSVCVLDLPGSVLLIPQESLLGEPVTKRRIQYKGGCEPWWGAQLFSNLVSACSELMSGSVKCTKAGVKVEQGVYGQKQEIVLNSVEPLTLLLEF